MSGSLGAARVAMADAVATTGLSSHPRVPGIVNVPCAIVEPNEVDWRTAQSRGHDKWGLLVRVLLSTASNEAAQLARDEFFDRGDPKDVKDAVESHVPLRDGTAAQDVFVSSARKFDAWVFAGTAYLGVEFVVDVYL